MKGAGRVILGRIRHLFRIVLVIAMFGTVTSGIAGVSDPSSDAPAPLSTDGAPSIDSNYGSG